MEYCYVAVPARSQAFLVERRLKLDGLYCEITYMPREIMTDLCNMGVRFDLTLLDSALEVLRRSGIPSIRVFKEEKYPTHSEYILVEL